MASAKGISQKQYEYRGGHEGENLQTISGLRSLFFSPVA